MAKDSYLYQCKKVIDFQIVTSIWGRQFVDCRCDVLHNKWSKHLNQHPHANHLMSLWLFILYQLENATCLNHHSFKRAYYLSNQPNNCNIFFFENSLSSYLENLKGHEGSFKEQESIVSPSNFLTLTIRGSHRDPYGVNLLSILLEDL